MKGCLFRAIGKKYWKLLLSMLLVSAFGCATLTGLGSGFQSLKEALDLYVREGGYPDAIVTTDVTKRGQTDSLRALPGVAEANARLIGDLVLVSPSERYLSIRAMSFDEDEFQLFYFWDQADPGALDPVYLEYNFAHKAGIQAGDTVTIRVGGELRQYAAAGIVSRPETLAMEASDAISISSDDFGYVYAPRALLEKEANTEHRDAVKQWEEKSGELAEAEESARQEYENALAELDSAEAELNEKKAEFDEKRGELDEQQAELDRGREELARTQKELLEKKAEAETNQQELNDKKAEAEAKQAELEQAQKELDEKRAELEETEKTLLEQRKTLAEQREEAQAQLSSLQSAKEELLAGQEALEQARAELVKGRRELNTGRANLLEKREEVVQTLELLRIAEGYLSRLDTLTETINTEDLLDQFSGLADAYHLREEADALRSQLNDLGGSIGGVGNISRATVENAINQANNGLNQIDYGLIQIEEGLTQIKAGLEQVDEKEKELNDGLTQVQEGEAALTDALRQMDDGLGQMDEGLEQIADGYREIDDYQAQIDSGFSELAEGFVQLADYQAQLDEGFAQLQAGEEEIRDALQQIEDGETQIKDAIADAERQIAEGEEQLSSSRTEVENGWIEALAEFADVKDELRKAAEELSEWEGYQVFCNQFLFRFSPGASPEAVFQDIKAALAEADVEVKSAVLYKDSPIKRRIDNNLIPIETMADFIPMFFFAIAMIVVYLFMSLTIRQCRREIGILRALGFTRFRVVFLFCGMGFAVSLGAIALGLAISLAIRGYFCYYFFDVLFPLPIHVTVFNWQKFLLSAALTIAVVQLATLVSASAISGVQPSEAMTRVKPSNVKIPRLTQWLIRGASPFLKFSVISLLRNRLRFLFSAFCLAGSVTLIFISLSLISSSSEIMDRTFVRGIHYDCQIIIGGEAGGELRQAIAALPYVSDVESMDYYKVDFSMNGHTEKANLVAMGEHTELISLEDQKKNALPITEDGVVLDRYLAQRLGASAGDTVWINGKPVRVSAVSEQCATRFQYITDVQAQTLGECELRSLICRVPVEHESEFMRFLVEQDGYLYAVFTHSAYSALLHLLEGANLACWILIGIAMVIGLVIVVNTTQTNLLEQKRELCVLRTLGFQHRELSLHWFAQSVLHFLCSCALGFPIGVVTAKKALLNMEMTNRSYPFVNGPWEYAVTAGLVFAYIVFSHFLSMRSLKRWDIVECVKDKE